MSYRKVNNRVQIAGQITYIHFFDKVATIIVNTGLSDDGKHSNYPKAVVFDKVLDAAHKYKVGDYVLINATMQSNKASLDLPPRTIAVNQIIKLNPENPKYHTINKFDFWGNVINPTKVAENKVKATVLIFAGQPNYITVYFETDDAEKMKAFCDLTRKKFVHLTGQIRTNRVLTDKDEIEFFDKLMVKDFDIIK